MHTAVIGTGLMGRPMARRLLAAGHEVAVYNRTASHARPLVEQGAVLLEDPRTALRDAEVTILMLQDFPVIRDLLLPEGSLPELAGRTLIQMGTIAPRESLRLREHVQEAGGEYLEAPVLGSRPQARDGKLLLMVGSSREQFARWLELLRCFGPEPRWIGEVGQAAALKLAFNQMIAAHLAGFSLSLGLIRRREIDPEVFMSVLRDSAFYAPTYDAKLPGLLARDFADPNFPGRLLLKDVDLVRGEVEALGLESVALDGLRALVHKAVEMGLGDLDYSAVYEAVDPQ